MVASWGARLKSELGCCPEVGLGVWSPEETGLVFLAHHAPPMECSAATESGLVLGT